MAREYSKEEVRAILQVLKDFNDDMITPSEAMIAFELEQSIQYVQDIMEHLIDKGIVEKC